MTLRVVMVVVFILMTIGIGFYARRHTASVTGFVLGGRSVGGWLSSFAYGTSYFSAVVFIGYAGQFGWKYGIASVWIGLGNAIIGSLLAWRVLGSRTRAMTKSMDARTMPEFFGTRFESQNLRVFASFIVFIFLIPYTASVYNGLSRLFGMAFGLPYEWCVIGMAVVTCIYVVLGGYMATVLNDAVQGVIMLFGIIAVVLVILGDNGGLVSAVDAMAQIPAITGDASTTGQLASMWGPDFIGLMFVIILTSFGAWGLPQMVQKFYAISDDSAVKKGAIISTVFALIVAGGSYFLGGFGRLYSSVVTFGSDGVTPVYDSIIPSMLSTLPNLLIGLIVVLVLSASMSTLSSLVLTSSSTMVLDFMNGRLIKKPSVKSQLSWMRVLLVAFVAISAIIALVQYTSPITFIAQLMGISWGALAGSFLAPYLLSLYCKRITATSVWVNFIVAVTFTTGNMLMGFPINPIVAGAIAMMAGMIIVPVVSIFTPKMDPTRVKRMFDCFKVE